MTSCRHITTCNRGVKPPKKQRILFLTHGVSTVTQLFKTVLISSIFVVLLVSSTVAGESARFVLQASGAKEVFVYGSFDRWSKGHKLEKKAFGQWTLDMELARGRYEYKFLVDGEWRINNDAPSIDDGFGSVNNLLSIQK